VFELLPYSWIVGADDAKLALELAFIAPRLGGVLISGPPGTGKSTLVRSFGNMMYGRLPVTLPINATEDRVVGGWKPADLVNGTLTFQPGLLQEADQQVLYVDEINLLDDHIVNIMLDVVSTGILEIQREAASERIQVSLTLVGTMNPEEGDLRPQLRDRFGLMAIAAPETDVRQRQLILKRVLDFDALVWRKNHEQPVPELDRARAQDERRRQSLERARALMTNVRMPDSVRQHCVRRAMEVGVNVGHRGDYVLTFAASACAARSAAEAGDENPSPRVRQSHVDRVAELVLAHRRATAERA
jgi:magnesium chelatase subunit I